MAISKNFRRSVQILCLLVFAALALSINFFHTENSAAGQANCPACHFLAFSQSVGPAFLFVLPLLVVLGAVCVEASVRFAEVDIRLFFSRSPPIA